MKKIKTEINKKELKISTPPELPGNTVFNIKKDDVFLSCIEKFTEQSKNLFLTSTVLWLITLP